jgi:prephenate dehydratase
MHAIGWPETDLRQVTTVHSHKAGLNQSSAWLDRQEIDDRKGYGSTVQAIESLRDDHSGKVIALGSEESATDGLIVLEREVTNLPLSENITRFYIVVRNGVGQILDPSKNFHAIVIPTRNIVGGLCDRLGSISWSGLDLNSIHSHTDGDSAQFLIEMENGTGIEEERVQVLIDRLRREVEDLQELGSWDFSIAPEFITANGSNNSVTFNVDEGVVDYTQPHHSFFLELKNRPGILHLFLDEFRQHGINLFDLQSKTLAHRRYGFTVGLDRGEMSPQNLQTLLSYITRSGSTVRSYWIGSSNDRDELKVKADKLTTFA